MKLSLHRSLIFWFGLLVIAFTFWAWHDSRYFSTSLITGRGSWVHGACGLGVHWNAPRPPLPDFSREPDPLNRKYYLFQRPFIFRGLGESRPPGDPTSFKFSPSLYQRFAVAHRYKPRDVVAIFFPHWLMLLVFTLVWLALLFWRARRRRRIASTARD